jgi:hypothetical protein
MAKEPNHIIRNGDDLEAAILADELADAHELALEGSIKMSVREYAKYKSKVTGTIVQPQLIYYYIRTGKIKEEPCICGRKVIDVKSADEFFAKRDAKNRSDS